MAKLEAIEDVVARVRRDLESITKATIRIREDVAELHERFHHEGKVAPWSEAEALQSIRRNLHEWIVTVQTGEVKP